ncbi:conserved hypothetical protein [delta proteobacterium NaphS2]|nr:conserved hypothetical protein [delta proteobacterium NaphS2]
MEDFPEAVRGFLPKLTGYALRFAGVLYLINVFSYGDEPGAILNVADIEKGIKVSEFYLSHTIEAMHALVAENADVPFEKTDQVIHLVRTLDAIRDEVDGGLIAVGFIQENFNKTCGEGLNIKSDRAMGSILRKCGLTIDKKKHWKDRHGVNCLRWDEKIELFIKECPQRPQSPQTMENQIVVRPGKVAYFSGCESRPGRLASHWVVSPWIDGSNPRD